MHSRFPLLILCGLQVHACHRAAQGHTLSLMPTTRLNTIARCPPSTLKRLLETPYNRAPPPMIKDPSLPAALPWGMRTFFRFCILLTSQCVRIALPVLYSGSVIALQSTPSPNPETFWNLSGGHSGHPMYHCGTNAAQAHAICAHTSRMFTRQQQRNHLDCWRAMATKIKSTLVIAECAPLCAEQCEGRHYEFHCKIEHKQPTRTSL